MRTEGGNKDKIKGGESKLKNANKYIYRAYRLARYGADAIIDPLLWENRADGPEHIVYKYDCPASDTRKRYKCKNQW